MPRKAVTLTKATLDNVDLNLFKSKSKEQGGATLGIQFTKENILIVHKYSQKLKCYDMYKCAYMQSF